MKPGMQTLVQDLGRAGCQAFGVPVGGALDRGAAITANRLVGNPPTSPLLEIALAGPDIAVHDACTVAITGGATRPMYNSQPLPLGKPVSLEAGGVLTFAYPQEGSHGYLAVGGEWEVSGWLGSVSPLLYSPEVTPGSRPVRGSFLKIHRRPSTFDVRPVTLTTDYPDHLEIAVVPGPELNRLPATSIQVLFSERFTVGRHINRMGIRLEESVRRASVSKPFISSGVVPGTVQLTRSGKPVILLADAQTTGGYPRILQVITPELDRLAQVRPGNTLSFRQMTHERATELTVAYLERYQFPVP
ncbi:MAG: biotin-dependent carboxyltransferase family protein [Saprospiraceae bacterium]|nr:biotin-dependent carboxyltransferase family protein [Saprospiraceae bacterium]